MSATIIHSECCIIHWVIYGIILRNPRKIQLYRPIVVCRVAGGPGTARRSSVEDAGN